MRAHAHVRTLAMACLQGLKVLEFDNSSGQPLLDLKRDLVEPRRSSKRQTAKKEHLQESEDAVFPGGPPPNFGGVSHPWISYPGEY